MTFACGECSHRFASESWPTECPRCSHGHCGDEDCCYGEPFQEVPDVPSRTEQKRYP